MRRVHLEGRPAQAAQALAVLVPAHAAAACWTCASPAPRCPDQVP